MPWVQVLSQIRFPDESGKKTMRFTGEILFWPNKVEAAQWVESGHIAYLNIGDKAPEGTGVLWRDKKDPPGWLEALGFEVKSGDFECPFPITVAMGPKAKPHSAMLLLALKEFVRHGWDMAMPLLSYRRLAEDIGTNGDRERTKEVIHDLRAPIYATDLVLMKRDPVVFDFIEAFKEERALGENEQLAFLRALYKSDVAFWPLQKSLYSGK